MKKRIICMSVVLCALLLTSSGCASNSTNSNAETSININTSDNAAAETQADSLASVSSTRSKQTSSNESVKTDQSGLVSEKESSLAVSKSESSESSESIVAPEDSTQHTAEFFAVENPIETSISVASLNGEWHCTTSDASLWFAKGDDINSGTWHDNMEEGDVKLEYSENSNGEQSYWYNLYNNRDQLWYSIYATGEIPFDELVVKNDDGDDFHYVRETEEAETDSEFSDNKYFEVIDPVQTSISVASLDGVWHCTTSNASLWFTKGDDIYSGTWHDEMEEGSVKLEYSESDSGEKTYWYNLYNNRGQLMSNIYATGEIPFDELVVKNDDGDDFHYVRESQ